MTQKEKVLKYMTDNGSITSMEAFRNLGITRLSARIFELRQTGVVVEGERITKKDKTGETITYMKYTCKKVA